MGKTGPKEGQPSGTSAKRRHPAGSSDVNPTVNKKLLYLVHLAKGSTTLKVVQKIRALRHYLVEWERYKPTHRDVTMCGNCLNPGHGTKHCHMKSRCSKCGGSHRTSDCVEEESKIACLNCGGQHQTTSRSCPKRAEFIKFRREVAERKQGPKSKSPKNPFDLDHISFPLLPQPKRTIPVLNPLPLPPDPQPGTSGTNCPPPGFRTYAQTAAVPPEDAPYSMEHLAFLFNELDRQIRACRTNSEQVAVMMRFYYQHRSIRSPASQL